MQSIQHTEHESLALMNVKLITEDWLLIQNTAEVWNYLSTGN